MGNHQQRDVAVAGAAKRAPPGGRRALGDIGNLVNVQGVVVVDDDDDQGKVLQTRPVVARSFAAQLLSNAQTAYEMRQIPIIPADHGAVAKPEMEETGKENPKSHRRCSKKKVHTLTSVLTARSKAACGNADNNKPKETIIDIDGADADNNLAAVEYVDDLYRFYKLTESSSMVVHDYMDLQNQINGHMRMILVDWLIEVHNNFELEPETLYLTMHIVDRYFAMNLVKRKEMQLVGISAMLIASKYEEIWAPEVNDFVYISDKVYDRRQILAMEKSILGKLGWTLTVPTPYHFLVRFVKAAVADKEMENMTFFLAELGLMRYAMIKYCPSMLAASAVYAAHSTLKKTPLWNETLKVHTGFAEAQLVECAKELASFHSAAPEHTLGVVYRKYSRSEHSAVALFPPANNLLT